MEPTPTGAGAGAGSHRAGLARLEAEIVACRACPRLVAWREEVAATKRAAFRDEEYWARPVPGFGDPDAGVVVVGLAPAAHGANRTGRMFTGDRSGDFLYAALHRAGLASQPTSLHRDDGLRHDGVWVTAPVRCAPPQNSPSAEERARCRPFLEAELAILDGARVYVALGALALRALSEVFEVSPRPRFAHGAELEVEVGSGDPATGGRRVTIVSSYHVSQQNTFTGRLTEPMFDDVIRRALALSGRR